MSDVHEALRALLADTRQALDAAAGRGWRTWSPEAALPEAVRPEGDEAASVAAPDEPPPEAPPPPEPEPAAPGWARLAREGRASRPLHHDDGTGAEGLAAIREDLGDCRRCGLCEGRRSIVFGVGDPEADLMIVGEGPGEQEDLRGEPFVGPAGQMLDRMLEGVLGLRREQVYIANVVKCRPPGNRNPADDEATTCLPFLERQVRAVQPRLVLALGNVPLKHLLGLRGITRMRGRETRWLDVPTLPLFHPAYLLRSPEKKRPTFEDLKLARRRYDALGGKR